MLRFSWAGCLTNTPNIGLHWATVLQISTRQSDIASPSASTLIHRCNTRNMVWSSVCNERDLSPSLKVARVIVCRWKGKITPKSSGALESSAWLTTFGGWYEEHTSELRLRTRCKVGVNYWPCLSASWSMFGFEYLPQVECVNDINSMLLSASILRPWVFFTAVHRTWSVVLVWTIVVRYKCHQVSHCDIMPR